MPILHFPAVLWETCGISASQGWQYCSSQNRALLRKGQFQNFSISTLFHTFTVPPSVSGSGVACPCHDWPFDCSHVEYTYAGISTAMMLWAPLHLQGFSRWTAWRVKCGLGLSTLSVFAIFWSRLRRGAHQGKLAKGRWCQPYKTGFVFFSTEKFNC